MNMKSTSLEPPAEIDTIFLGSIVTLSSISTTLYKVLIASTPVLYTSNFKLFYLSLAITYIIPVISLWEIENGYKNLYS